MGSRTVGRMALGGVPEDLLASLKLDEASRESRLAFVEIGEEDRRHLGELAEAISPHVDSLIAVWYEFLLNRTETKDLLDRGRVQSHLRIAQAGYFHQLLAAAHDRDYFRERLRIGYIHQRVGLEPAWYMGAYRKYVDLVRCFLGERGVEPVRIVAWMRALEKVVYLDMELALAAYFDTAHRELLDANAALRRATDELEDRNRELIRQYEKVQEAARLKEEFLSRVSHELRTPLNSVLGYADLLLDGIEGPLSEGQGGAVRTIRDQGGRLLRMIDWVIDTAKTAAGVNPEPETFDPLPALSRAAEGARAACEAKGLLFELEVPGDVPSVRGDGRDFERALQHLLENAVKFTESGGVGLTVGREGATVRFTIRDSGPGIPEAHRDRIFEPFHQVDAGDTRTTTGLGVGLTLARRLIGQMGGELRLENASPEGSTFVVELPAAAPEPVTPTPNRGVDPCTTSDT